MRRGDAVNERLGGRSRPFDRRSRCGRGDERTPLYIRRDRRSLDKSGQRTMGGHTDQADRDVSVMGGVRSPLPPAPPSRIGASRCTRRRASWRSAAARLRVGEEARLDVGPMRLRTARSTPRASVPKTILTRSSGRRTAMKWGIARQDRQLRVDYWSLPDRFSRQGRAGRFARTRSHRASTDQASERRSCDRSGPVVD